MVSRCKVRRMGALESAMRSWGLWCKRPRPGRVHWSL